MKTTALLRSQVPRLPSAIIVPTFPTLTCLFQICSFIICVHVAHIYLICKCQVHVVVPSYNNHLLSAFYVPGTVLNAFSYFVSFSTIFIFIKITIFIAIKITIFTSIFTLKKLKHREVKSLTQVTQQITKLD